MLDDDQQEHFAQTKFIIVLNQNAISGIAFCLSEQVEDV